MAVRGVRSSWETLATNSVRTCSSRRSSVISWRMMTTPGSSPGKRRGTACTFRTRSEGSGSLISRLTTSPSATAPLVQQDDVVVAVGGDPPLDHGVEDGGGLGLLTLEIVDLLAEAPRHDV